MTQLEIKFFWPLTEQMPLDLDYTDCERPKVYANNVLSIANGGTGIAIWSVKDAKIQPCFRINLDDIKPTVIQKKMPWYRKLAYKLLGMKVE